MVVAVINKVGGKNGRHHSRETGFKIGGQRPDATNEDKAMKSGYAVRTTYR